jgi:hypothetical protein
MDQPSSRSRHVLTVRSLYNALNLRGDKGTKSQYPACSHHPNLWCFRELEHDVFVHGFTVTVRLLQHLQIHLIRILALNIHHQYLNWVP